MSDISICSYHSITIECSGNICLSAPVPHFLAPMTMKEGGRWRQRTESLRETFNLVCKKKNNILLAFVRCKSEVSSYLAIPTLLYSSEPQFHSVVLDKFSNLYSVGLIFLGFLSYFTRLTPALFVIFTHPYPHGHLKN